MAMNAMTAITKAMIGVIGNKGTLNGLTRSGSFFLRTSNEIIDMIYKLRAPKHAIVIISPVLPVSKAIIPIPILTINATAGVLNF